VEYVLYFAPAQVIRRLLFRARRLLFTYTPPCVGGEESAFVKQFPYGGEVGGGDGIAGTITAKHWQAAPSGMLEHQVGRLGRFGKAGL
jgi:hypothetical protein